MARKRFKRLSWWWNFLNRPLCVTLIVATISFIVIYSWGKNEKIRCDIIIHPNIDYMRKNLNSTDSEINLFIEMYSKPFYSNLTFDSYTEAVAYKKLWIDSPIHAKWYTPTLDCDPKKIILPLEIKDIVKK